MLCLLSQLALELLELLRGVAAESLVGFLQSTNLSRNLVLFRLGKPARRRGNLSGYCPNQPCSSGAGKSQIHHESLPLPAPLLAQLS